MKYHGQAQTPDMFLRMLVADLNLHNDLAWEVIHNVNLSNVTFPVLTDIDFGYIENTLQSMGDGAVFIYKSYKDEQKITLYSLHQKWRMATVSYNSKVGYEFEVLFLN